MPLVIGPSSGPTTPEGNATDFRSDLQGLENVLLTPHIGGSTEQAQEAIGREVSHSLIMFLSGGATLGAVNFPTLGIPAKEKGTSRIINVHRNVPGVLGEINGIFSKAGANIRAQYLSTDSNIGYVVIDIEIAEPQALYEQIAKLPTSIKSVLI